MTEPASSIAELRYVPFVDGLRTIAVVAVVAYHAGVPGVQSGFVGVDIFFVISGFLIINQIVASVRNGRFSLRTFWARRVIRILPPYLLVIAATAIAAPFILVLPDEMSDFGYQTLFSGLLFVNHYFLQQQGYFDTVAELKPLLHLWSLAVEEQFYVLAPLVIVALFWLRDRIGNWSFTAITTLLFMTSLVLCVWLTDAVEDRNYGFYLMPLRAWEFVAGGSAGMLALQLSRLPRSMVEILGLAGLATILLAVFGLPNDGAYPSYMAIFPVGGTTLVIAAGVARPEIAAARALALRPMVWVGLVSYSWYLWHWPLLAYTRIHEFGDLTLTDGLACAALSFVLATITYRLVEAPLKKWRKRTKFDERWSVSGAGIGAMVAAACLGLVLLGPVVARQQEGLPKWLALDTEYPSDPCALATDTTAEACINYAGGKPMGILIGDSHARALWRALSGTVKADGSMLATLMDSGCPAFFGVTKFNAKGRNIRKNCPQIFDRGAKLIGEVRPDFALLDTRWNTYAHRRGHGGQKAQSLGQAGSLTPANDQKDIFVRSLRNTIKALHEAGVKRIVVMGPPPEFSRWPPECVFRSRQYGLDPAQKCASSYVKVKRRRQNAISWIKTAIGEASDVRFLDPLDLFCDGKRCRPYRGDVVLFRDDNHYNRQGAQTVIHAFHDDISWLIGRKIVAD